MTREIPLTRGCVALVDDADYDWLMQWKWHVVVPHSKQYAARNAPTCQHSPRYIYLHRMITQAPTGLEVDHINGNGLDNRRCNLRLCKHQHSQHNQKKQNRKNSTTSQFKGVDWYKRDQKWRGSIQFDGKALFLGCFVNEIDAARAYDTAARKYFGDFACLNFPNEDYPI